MDAGRERPGVSGAKKVQPNVVRGARGKRDRRGFFLALGAVAVAGVGGISWAMQRARAGAAPVTVPTPAALPAGAARPEGYVLGSASAPVEIVEYADFECPGCGQFATVTEPDVRARLVNTGRARFRFYDFQVTQGHRNSPAASLAAACANDQGKFWELHDRLFAGQDEWNSLATDDPKSVFAGYAQAAGVDMARWNQCYDGRTHVQRLAQHGQEAERAQVRSTPTVVVGNQMLQGPPTFDAIKALVDSAKGGAPAAAAPAAGR
jgi:protein-disulfide isomerase